MIQTNEEKVKAAIAYLRSRDKYLMDGCKWVPTPAYKTDVKKTMEQYRKEYPRVKPAPAKPIENWYYLDETHQLHQLSKNQTFDDAYAEMEIAATKHGHPFIILVCEDHARNWRACLDRWLGNDKFPHKYKKRKGDL